MRPSLNAFVCSDRWRSFQWLALSVLLLHVALDFNLQERAPAWQMTLYYLGTVCMRANLGYWIARTTLGRLDGHSSDARHVARAIIIAAVVLTAK